MAPYLRSQEPSADWWMVQQTLRMPHNGAQRGAQLAKLSMALIYCSSHWATLHCYTVTLPPLLQTGGYAMKHDNRLNSAPGDHQLWLENSSNPFGVTWIFTNKGYNHP